MSGFSFEIEIPGYATPVRVVNRGEHHMGSDLIEIYLPFLVQGIDRFETTNGFAYYSAETSSLIVGDIPMVICIHIGSGEVTHSFRPHKNWYFLPRGNDLGCSVLVKIPKTNQLSGSHSDAMREIRLSIPWKDLALAKGFGPIVRDTNRALLPSAQGYDSAFAESPWPMVSAATNGDVLFEQTIRPQVTIQICKDVAIQAAVCSEVIKVPEYTPVDIEEWLIEIDKGNLALVCKLLFKRATQICACLKLPEPIGMELPPSDNLVTIEFLDDLNDLFNKLMHNNTF